MFCCVGGVARKACERHPMGLFMMVRRRSYALVVSRLHIRDLLMGPDACASSGWLGNVAEQVSTNSTWGRVVELYEYGYGYE